MNYIDLEQKFYGRADILDILKKRVIGLKDGYRQNIALLGNQYVGKSSVLKRFLMNLDEPNILTIYLDLENKDFGYVFEKCTGSLLYNFSKMSGLVLHEDFNLLIESTRSRIPHTIQVIHKIQEAYGKGKFDECYLGLLTLPEVFTNETGWFCVFVVDEFQNLESFNIKDSFLNLGQKIMTQKRCLYVLSSSFEHEAKRIISDKLSLLFGNFEVIHVEPFDLQSSQDFIGSNLDNLKIGVQLRSFLTDFTGGHPLYLNLLCQEIMNLAAIHNQNEVYMPLIVQALENTIFLKWGVMSRHFELIMNEYCRGKGNLVVSPIMMAIANGSHKIEALVEATKVKRTPLKQRLVKLIEMGVIVKNGNFYYFKDKLFRYWIKYVYQKRIRDVEFSPDKQRKEFKEEIHQCIESFNVTSRKDFSSRIIELLHCFDNESFDINGRRYKLPQFKEIIPFKVRNDAGQFCDVLKARTEKSLWLIVLKKELLSESELLCVMKEGKKIGVKPEKRLLISLMNLDDHTRLKALQERFWIWNEGELNTLLTLFDKPYIV